MVSESVFLWVLCVSSFPVLFCFYWPVCFLQKERYGAGWVGRWEYLGGGGETYNQNILHENIFNQKKKIYKTFSVKGFTKVTFFSVWLPKKESLVHCVKHKRCYICNALCQASVYFKFIWHFFTADIVLHAFMLGSDTLPRYSRQQRNRFSCNPHRL